MVPALQAWCGRRRIAGAHPRAVDARRARRARRRRSPAKLFEDADPALRIQAVRASETLYKAGDRTFATTTVRSRSDPDTDVVIQAMLTLNILKVPERRRRRPR